MQRIIHVGNSKGAVGIADDFVMLTELQGIRVDEVKSRNREPL
jgi:hypothetical protein